MEDGKLKKIIVIILIIVSFAAVFWINSNNYFYTTYISVSGEKELQLVADEENYIGISGSTHIEMFKINKGHLVNSVNMVFNLFEKNDYKLVDVDLISGKDNLYYHYKNKDRYTIVSVEKQGTIKSIFSVKEKPNEKIKSALVLDERKIALLVSITKDDIEKDNIIIMRANGQIEKEINYSSFIYENDRLKKEEFDQKLSVNQFSFIKIKEYPLEGQFNKFLFNSEDRIFVVNIEKLVELSADYFLKLNELNIDGGKIWYNKSDGNFIKLAKDNKSIDIVSSELEKRFNIKSNHNVDIVKLQGDKLIFVSQDESCYRIDKVDIKNNEYDSKEIKKSALPINELKDIGFANDDSYIIIGNVRASDRKLRYVAFNLDEDLDYAYISLQSVNALLFKLSNK